MQFKPKSEAQLKEAERIRLENLLWPDGEYEFNVISAAEKRTKDKFDTEGNVTKAGGVPMIELKLQIFKEDGSFKFLHDWLSEIMEFKIRHAAYACGLGEDYESGTITDGEFEGKSGRLLLTKKPASGGYAAGNQVKDYIVSDDGKVAATKAKTAKAQAVSADEPFSDFVPF